MNPSTILPLRRVAAYLNKRLQGTKKCARFFCPYSVRPLRIFWPLKRIVRQTRVRYYNSLEERNSIMPVIARFYGIVVKMYFSEHGVPHFHAIYGEFNSVYNINTLEQIEGDLPPRAHRLVIDWATV